MYLLPKMISVLKRSKKILLIALLIYAKCQYIYVKCADIIRDYSSEQEIY